jgi:hypothetical protein
MISGSRRVLLTDSPRTKHIHAGERFVMRTISRADVAWYLLELAEHPAPHPDHHLGPQDIRQHGTGSPRVIEELVTTRVLVTGATGFLGRNVLAEHLYREFGVEAAPRALLHPRVLLPGIRPAIRGCRLVPARPHGGILGLPADFLLSPGNRVLARKYGTHAYDQWTVNELLDHAR